MPFTPEQAAAMAGDLLRELQGTGDPALSPGRGPAISTLPVDEYDPELRLEDILPPAGPAPETLLGGAPTARRRGPAVPPLPFPPDGVPDALQPQSEAERRALQQDAESFGTGVRVAGTVAATNPIGRAVGSIPAVVAAAPRTATALAGLTGLTAAASTADSPGDPVAAREALARLMTQQQEALARQREITQERAAFATLTTPDQIKEAQRRLNALGYDAGPVDGREGRQWRDALRRYNADRQADLGTIAGQIGGLASQIAAAQRQVKADQDSAARESGNQRMRDMEENTPWYRQAWRDYGPYAGALLGGIVGYTGRSSVGKAIDSRSRLTADRADELMEAGARGGVPGRAARVNQFWTEGGGRPAPFTAAPGQRPYAFTSNPAAPPADTLYQPGTLSRFAPGVGLAGVGAVEAGLGQYFAVGPARQELQAAFDAANADPSEVNVRRLQAARDKLAGAEALAFFGRGAMAGVGAAEVKAQLRYAPSRPNVSAAETERSAVDQLLSRRPVRPAPTSAPTPSTAPAVAPGTPAPEGSIWVESAQAWMGPAIPGRPGRPFLSRNYAPPRDSGRSSE